MERPEPTELIERLWIPKAKDVGTLQERQFDQRPSRSRTETQRDHDRVLYSSAFKRLAHVTQVTASETGLMFHSRLTHSLKVAQFARRLAERLQKPERGFTGAAKRAVEALDADAAETAALAHDLGHPPFGHLAETELNTLAASYGGFEGNAQSFRILTRLARRAKDHEGLNLTRITLNGVLKYPWPHGEEGEKKWNAYMSDRDAFDWVREKASPSMFRSLEAQIMDWADDVTYAVHDMDDFYRAGLVPLERLCQDTPEFDVFETHLRRNEPERADALCAGAQRVLKDAMTFNTPYAGTAAERIDLRGIGSWLITRYIEGFTITNRAGNSAIVSIDQRLRDEVDALKQLMWCYVILRPSLGILQHGQRHIITELYKIYSAAALDKDKKKKKFGLFPAMYVPLLESAITDETKLRAVVDLISSMTEATATEVYRRMTGVAGASVSDPTGRMS